MTLFAVLLISRDAREVYALPLLLPLALLAVPGIERLPDWLSSTWYRSNVVGFSVVLAVAWVAWSALELGLPLPLQRTLLSFNPGYEPGFKLLPFLAGLAYTVAWIAIVRWLRPSAARPLVVWTTGLSVTWALAMTLFVGWIDSGMSYRAVVASMLAALPASYDCISSRHVGESERAMFEYFGGIETFREENPARRRACSLLLIQMRSAPERPESGHNGLIWEGGRPGNPHERFLLYRAVDAIEDD
jgi:hypothetical protein